MRMSGAIKRMGPRLAVALMLVALMLCLEPEAPRAIERSATPGSLEGVFEASEPGDTILLASGDYGVFRGGMKGGEVVLRPHPGATPAMQLEFRPAANITLDGVTLTGIWIADRATKNIVVRNSDIPGQTTMRTDELENANILFDGNVHRDWDKTDACRCGEGRISLHGDNTRPTGITIQNSEFRGGMSDGIQNGSNGTRIIANRFHHLTPGTPDGVHTDAIQLYGSSNTLIKGNYFHDLGAAQIMAPDGARHEIIEDNVFGPGDYPFAITLWSDEGSSIRHNTFAPGSCWWELPCGIVTLGQKDSCRYPSECDPGRGTVIEDNILADIGVREGDASFTSRFNLFNGSRVPYGPNDLLGVPRFAAGPRPTTYHGYALASDSPGTRNASDGLDRGVRIGDRAPSAQKRLRRTAQIRVLSTLRSIRRSGNVRLRIRTTARGRAVASATVRPGRARRGARDHARSLIRLKPVSRRVLRPRWHDVTLAVGQRARRILEGSHDARITVRLQLDGYVTTKRSTLRS